MKKILSKLKMPHKIEGNDDEMKLDLEGLDDQSHADPIEGHSEDMSYDDKEHEFEGESEAPNEHLEGCSDEDLMAEIKKRGLMKQLADNN